MSLFGKFPREMGFPERRGEYRIVHNQKEFYDALNKYNGRTNVYSTIYSFSNLKKGKYGIEYPEYDSAIVDKIFFDLDSINSFKNIKKLHKLLLNLDLIHCLIMSGGGFHCYVKCKIHNLKNPKDAIANVQRKIVEKIGLEIGDPKEADIDEHIIGDIARISRIPNTFNLKRKCFCVPLKNTDFNIFKSLHDIQEAAKEQRLIPIQWYGNKKINIDKFDYPTKKPDIRTIEIPMGKFDIEEYGDEKMWPCVRKMLTEHTNHKFRYWGVIWLREMGFTEEEAKEICKKYLSKFSRNDGTINDFIHMQKHDHVFETVYHKGEHFFPYCEKLYREGLCEGKCKWYGRMYVK